MRVSSTVHPWFLAVAISDRITAKSLAPCSERNPPEIFYLSFIIRASGLPARPVLMKGTRGSGQEPQHVIPAGLQTQQQIMPRSTSLTTPALARRRRLGRQRWLGFMEGQSIGHDRVIPSLEALHKTWWQRFASRARARLVAWQARHNSRCMRMAQRSLSNSIKPFLRWVPASRVGRQKTTYLSLDVV